MSESKKWLVWIAFLMPLISYGSLQTLTLSPAFESFIISRPYFVEKEDSTVKLTFADILKDSADFELPLAKHFSNPTITHAYWFKIRVTNASRNREFYLVSHNYGLSEVDVYWKEKDQQIHQEHFDRRSNVYQREIVNRQPVFKIHLDHDETKEIYVRVKNTYSSEFSFELYRSNDFFSHYVIENLLFGMFYGMLFFVILYNSTLYFSLRQGYLLALVLFNIVQIISMSFRDGNSVFLFLGSSDFTLWLESLVLRMFFFSLSIFCILFLNLRSNKRIYFYLLGINTFNLVFSQLNFEFKDFYSYHIDMLVLGSCMVISLAQWIKGQPLAKFVFGGVCSLFVTYFVYYLSVFDVISVYYFSFFSLYLGVIAESIFLTFASSEKIKLIQIDHLNIEKMNKELEFKVEQRTKIIKEQNKMLEQKAEELNQFLYKSSHDLKGPIKSIEGLCLVAKLEKPEKQAEYLEKIRERTKVLSTIIADLNQVIVANNAPVAFTTIDFEAIHSEISHLFEAFPGYDETRISFEWKNRKPFISDRRMIYSIYQNLFENAIKYRDRTKKCALSISIDSTDTYCSWEFADNGIGISKEFKDKVFEMFFRANDTFQDSNGLGLYLVKLYTEKLKGQISIESEEGVGTTMKILFKV